MTSRLDLARVVRVALVTDSPTVGVMVKDWLSDELTPVARHPSLRHLHESERPDLVILERRMLEDTHRDLIQIRRRWPTIEVAVIGVSCETEVVALLDAGADDAIRAGSQACVSRLHALARRARTLNAGTRIAVGDVIFDREARRIWCAGREVFLTPTEQSVLDCLFWYAPRIVDVAGINDFVWGGALTDERRRLLRVYVGYLRTKLRESRTVRIRTVRGRGYALTERT